MLYLMLGCSYDEGGIEETAIVPTATSIPIPTPIVPTVEPTMEFEVAETAESLDQAISQNVEVEIKLFQFPENIEVQAGTAVTWINQDGIIHSITSGTAENQTDDFDSGFFDQGESVTLMFDEPGVYTYFCRRHNFMQGTVTVTD